MIDPKKLNKSPARFMNRCRRGSAIWGKTWRKNSSGAPVAVNSPGPGKPRRADVQTQVLLRTREKLALLEQRLSELENRPLNAPAAPDAEEKL